MPSVRERFGLPVVAVRDIAGRCPNSTFDAPSQTPSFFHPASGPRLSARVRINRRSFSFASDRFSPGRASLRPDSLFEAVMRNWMLGLLVVIGVAAAVEEARAQTVGTPELPSPRMLGPLRLERMWWNQATLNTQRDKVRFLTADE